MNKHITHDTFSIERSYASAPAKVFAAWSNKDAKAKWFAGPAGWKELERTMDFREGGTELAHGRFPDGGTSHFKCHYLAIIPNERIIYSYDMAVNGKRMSLSLATIEFWPDGSGTRLKVTEQGAFYDGKDDAASRKEGTEWLLGQLDASLKAG